LRDPTTPAPVASDASGQSSQQFAMEIIAERGRETRRIAASGRDIYAVTAPLVVEALERVVDGRAKALGVTTAGATFDARDFLDSLAPDRLRIY
jgi:hypothetical protein